MGAHLSTLTPEGGDGRVRTADPKKIPVFVLGLSEIISVNGVTSQDFNAVNFEVNPCAASGRRTFWTRARLMV